jgi:hypothetical protein
VVKESFERHQYALSEISEKNRCISGSMAVSVRGNPEPGPLTRCVMLGQRADVAAFSDPESQPSKPPTENTAGSLITRFLEPQPGFFSEAAVFLKTGKRIIFLH